MAKKRGGLAGLYDRNKGLFRTAAILGGTALGGPAGGAAAGAAFRGLDRPGKRGIGFDPFEGLKGGVEGYAMGKTAQGIGGGIKGMLTGKGAAAASAAPAGGAPFDFSGAGIGMPVGGAEPIGPQGLPNWFEAGSFDKIPGQEPTGFMGNLQKNWQVISGVGKGLGTAINYQQQQRLAEQEAAREQAAQRRMDEEFALRKGEIERQRASRERLTQMLLPLFQANLRGLAPDQYRLPQG